jgi:DUF1680 family protein
MLIKYYNRIKFENHLCYTNANFQLPILQKISRIKTLQMNKWSFPLIAAAILWTGTRTLAQSYVPQENTGNIKVKPVVAIKAYAFDLTEVKLLPSLFSTAMDADAKYLLLIEPDRLMAEFRSHSGLTPKGKKYGGWEDSSLAGHTLGHYLSACAMQYASTGNKEFLTRVNYIVDELAECQAARKTGYIGAIPDEDRLWAEIAKGEVRSRGFDLNGVWSPWYTVHKTLAGLLDAYFYCNNAKALQVNTALSDWTGTLLKDLSDANMQKMMLCEYGGMNDVLVNTYAITGNKKYLELSYRFHDRVILDSLAHQKDILPGRHSNTQIPKIIGVARRYEVTGDQKDLAIARFFWETIAKDHSYATGGNSNYEYLSEPGKLNDKLTDNTTETCNTYNMLKLTRHLFELNPSAELMDFYEKGLYNHILASQNHTTGMMCYFVPLRMGGKKEFSDQFNTFTCCVGSGMENHVKYGESIYFKGKDGSLYVNLFIPSVLTWKEKGITFKQDSNLPETDLITFTLTTNKSLKFPIRLRKPQWAKNTWVKVNGKTEQGVTIEDGYLVLNRKWKNNDKIEFYIPSVLHTEPMPDNADRRAIFYGPVLLSGKLGKIEPDPIKGIPVFVTTNNDPSTWLKVVDKKNLLFETVANTTYPSTVELAPFNEEQNDHYTVYWDVFTPEKWALQQKIYEEDKKKERDLEARTVDLFRVGEMQPERDHNLIAENAETGTDHNKKFRVANNGTALTFTMKVDGQAPNTLMASYWGMDNRGRKFDVYVDGKLIATEDLNKYKESRFYEIPYAIPAELTKGKKTVTVKMHGQEKNSAGPVYNIRMIRDILPDKKS